MSGDPEKTVDYAEKLRDFSRGARFDFAIWLLIVAMAAASFGLAHVPLGSFNLAIALAIAAGQISLVGLFFMELRRARALIVLTASSASVFVLILFALSLNDLFTRP